MFCSRTSNNLTNETHKSSWRLILNYHESSFARLLLDNNDISNQILLIEAFKATKNLAPPIIGMFNARLKNYNLNISRIGDRKKEPSETDFRL